MRSAFITAAQEHGLGAARQVHRALSSTADKAFGVILGGTAIGGLFFATRSDWLAVVIVIAVGTLLTVGYVNLIDPGSPRRVVVCDGGLLLDDPARPPQVVPWADIQSAGPVVHPGPVVTFEVTVEREGQVETIVLGWYSARSALTRSILTRRPAPISPWPRVVTAAVVVAVVGLAVWQVVLPRFVVREESALPSSSDFFSDACESPGVAYTGAAAYAGPAPHPLLVTPGGIRWRLEQANSPWYVADTAAIQLIACVELDGDDGPTGETCVYSTSDVGIGGRTQVQAMRSGWYTITVYELRTHRKVASSRVLGELRVCPETKLEDDDIYTTPSDAQLHEALDPYIQRAG